MKKTLAIITILVLILSILAPLQLMAATDNGEDAHSPSMSVGSGEEPILGESEIQDEQADEEVEEEEIDATEESNNWVIPVAVCGGIAVVAICVVAGRRSAGRKK